MVARIIDHVVDHCINPTCHPRIMPRKDTSNPLRRLFGRLTRRLNKYERFRAPTAAFGGGGGALPSQYFAMVFVPEVQHRGAVEQILTEFVEAPRNVDIRPSHAIRPGCWLIYLGRDVTGSLFQELHERLRHTDCVISFHSAGQASQQIHMNLRGQPPPPPWVNACKIKILR